MIARKEDAAQEVRERMREGPGSVTLLCPLKKEQYPPHIRLYATLVLKKGCGIGAHTHNGECEIYYILEGEAVYVDGGGETLLRPGDMSVTYSGESHSIRNEKNEDLKVLATIITE